ncbi:MAG: DUF2652 domain-containing protein [Thermodesulfobacteriota bacterium]
MQIKQVVLVLADISGYTRFVTLHSLSLIHAEEIISELMESVIDASEHPLKLNKLEGDAAFFFADSAGDIAAAVRDVYGQTKAFFDAFRRTAHKLSGEMSVCECEACKGIQNLRLKVFLHQGEVAVKRLRQFEELAGENVIILHRLLKNSVPSREYILMTESFFDLVGGQDHAGLESRTENYDDIGNVAVKVLYVARGTETEEVPAFSFAKDAKMTTRGAFRVLWRRLGFGRDKQYAHIADLNTTFASVLFDIVHACIIQYVPGFRGKDRQKQETDHKPRCALPGLSPPPVKDMRPDEGDSGSVLEDTSSRPTRGKTPDA